MSQMPSSRRVFLRQAAAIGAMLLPFRHPAFGAMPGEETSAANPLRSAMDRVAKCCLAWLDPDRRHLPTGGYEMAHDTGRWWDAMLRYEAATGTPIPGWAEEPMRKNLREMTENPAALLINEFGPPESVRVNLHNIRESLLTYTALVKHRNSDWAREQGRKLVETVGNLLNPDGQLNYPRLVDLMEEKPLNEDPLMVPHAPEGEWFDSTGTTGRAIEAMVWFGETTEDDAAMELAKRLAETHLRTMIDPRGNVRSELLNSEHVGHNHSYCGTLRGLLLYGLASGDDAYVDAVAKTYRNGLWGTTISHSGWTPHDLGKLRFPNQDGDPVGEHGSCSDVVQLALWLALRAGQGELLDDVERLLRARLFPSQISDAANPRNDGAWGVYAHPFGFGSTLDVFAAVLHVLVDVSNLFVTTAQDGTVSINLHFDCDTRAASLRTERADDAMLVVLPKRSARMRLRVPGWASRESLRLSTDDKSIPLRWDGSYLTLDAADVVSGHSITLRHDLPRKETVEEMPVSHRKFRLTWRGDEVIASDPSVPIYAEDTPT